MIKKITGISLLLFGTIGLLIELTNCTKPEASLDVFGVTLASLFIISGLLLYPGKHINLSAEHHFSWQTFLTTGGIIELIIGSAVTLFVIILGFQGFISGEMGTMVGIFSLSSLLFLLPYIILKAVMVYGLFKKKRWSLFLSLISGIIYLAGGVISVSISPVIAVLLFVYAGFTLWAGIKCLKTTSQ